MRSLLIALLLAPATFAYSALPIVLVFDRPQTPTFWRVLRTEADRIGARLGQRFRVIAPEDVDNEGEARAGITVRVRGECRITPALTRPILADSGAGLEFDCQRAAAAVARVTEPDDETVEQDILATAVIGAIAEYFAGETERRPVPHAIQEPKPSKRIEKLLTSRL